MAVDKQMLAALIVQIQEQLPEGPKDSGLPPARFALLLQAGQNPVATGAEIAEALESLDVSVGPLSPLEADVLVLTIPDRLMTPDGPMAFDIAHTITETFELKNCEPELFTDIMPEPEPERAGGPEESIDDFPPGCWAPHDTDLDGKPLWALKSIRVPEAWRYSEDQNRNAKGRGTVIAQPDTGVTRHPELNGIAQVPGFDFVDADDNVDDPLDYFGNPGHGTATGSVAVSPEGGAVTGSAPNARHMPIRAVQSVVRISQVAVAEAIDFAVENGAHVITMSLGGLPSFSLRRALHRAVNADVIVLAAAGNCVEYVVFPARYNLCIAIAGVDRHDKQWRGSCRGPDVDVSAPGENVSRATAKLENGQVLFDSGQGQGTSFAVALTAGVAALWLSHHGRANIIAEARTRGETVQDMFRRMMRATARRPGGDWDSTEMGAGIVDADELLKAEFEFGRDREAVGAFVEDTDAEVMRRLVLEATKAPDAALATIDWEQHGPEIAYAIFARKRGVAPPARGAEAPTDAMAALEQPALSPQLESALAQAPELAQALGR